MYKKCNAKIMFVIELNSWQSEKVTTVLFTVVWVYTPDVLLNQCEFRTEFGEACVQTLRPSVMRRKKYTKCRPRPLDSSTAEGSGASQ